MNYLKKFNEMHSNIVRASCASLASIKIDNNYPKGYFRKITALL